MGKTRHPADIVLSVSPLGEAWLEVRWKLQQMSLPGQAQDPDFPFALGLFYNSIKHKYKYRKDLDASRAPLDLLPHIVRHQFWIGESVWPVLQLGPGVATVNFTKPYTWATFREEAQFLFERLLEAYNGVLPSTESITLRYQNLEPFDFLKHDITAFLASGLNTTIRLPKDIPGEFSIKPFPTNMNLQVSYSLADPKSIASIIIGTGIKSPPGSVTPSADSERVAIWQFEIASQGTDAPAVSDLSAIMSWLDTAHTNIHGWFFSFIEGHLFSKYGGKLR